MSYAFDTTVTVDIPFDPPHTATIRKVSGWQLGRAQRAFFNDLIDNVQARGGAKVQKDIQTLFEKDPTEAAAQMASVQSDPLNGYDKATLISLGVKSMTSMPEWTSMKPEARVDLVRIQFGDEETDFFAIEVLRVAKPSLFLTKEEAKAAQREAEGAPSIA